MFEGKLPHTGASALRDSSAAGGDLRAVTWPDLVAKLDAVRDLRAAMRQHEDHGDASFDPGCARHIASLCDGKPGINLDDLVTGKAASGIRCPNSENAAGDAPRE